MSFEIYPPDFSTRYELTHAGSIAMTINYNDIGRLQLTAAINDYNIAALKIGNVLYDTRRKVSYIIVSTKCDATLNNRITVNCYSADWLFSKRVVAEPYRITNVERDVYGMVAANMRGLPNIKIASVKGLTANIYDQTAQEKTLQDCMTDSLETAELGRRMNWSDRDKEWTFEIYKGEDRTSGIHAVVFSEEQGSCSNLIIDTDVSTFKNVGYAKYKLTDDTEKTVEVGTAQGDDRHEIWFNISNLQERDETEEQCRAKTISQVTMELGRYIKRQSFKVEIDASELGSRYALGDKILCVSRRFGVSFAARITGVKYQMDKSGEKTSLILGTPTLTALGVIRLNA